MKKNTFLVTGGANGIGRYLVSQLVSLGHEVIFVDQDENGGQSLVKKLNNPHAIFIHEDLSHEKGIKGIIEKIKIQQVTIDTVIHNACISKGGIFNASYEDFMDVIKVGLTAPFYLTKLLLPFLSTQASIINIASTRAFQSQSNTEAYSATKGGIIALTHALSVSLSGIARVNSISPGWIDTTSDEPAKDLSDDYQHPVKRRGKPEDILKAVLYLADKNNTFVTGENITVDGGMSKLMIYHNDDNWHKA